MLLGKQQGKKAVAVGSDVTEDALSEAVARVREIADSKMESSEKVNKIVKLLVIPPKIEPIEWENFLELNEQSLSAQVSFV